MTPTAGDFALSAAGVAKLPNVKVTFPGEHWSDLKASEDIVPGELVIPISSGGKRYCARAGSADGGDPRSGIALRVVEVPDVNTGPAALGPNEIVNKKILAGEYVHMYRSGGFHLTLYTPDAGYLPAQLLRFDPGGARVAGKGGVGSWTRAGATAANAFLEVIQWRPLSAGSDTGILIVQSLRGQF
jgi:hypothetical protein